MSNVRTIGMTLLAAVFSSGLGYGGPQRPGDAAADDHTVALWLFDETPYTNVTLTDAGPYQLDLRLETGWAKPLPQCMRDGSRGLVKGRFGNALHLPLGDGLGVTWPEGTWKLYGTARMLDRGDEVPEICNLGHHDFTIEFWFKSDGPQVGPGVVWEVRNQNNAEEEYKYCSTGFNALVLDADRSRFLLRGAASMKHGRGVNWDQQLPLPTDSAKLNDGHWHHLAFTYHAAAVQTRHFVDGRLQPLPGQGGFLPLMGQLVSLRLGRDGEGKQELAGMLDEVRISDAVRYLQDFAPPESFSRNFGAQPPPVARADGPPLLFDDNRDFGPLRIEPGNNRYSFGGQSGEGLDERVETFERDPGWIAQGTRGSGCDFGHRPDGHAAAGAVPGDIAGRLAGAQRAFYAVPLGRIDLGRDALAAAGRAAFVECGDGDVLVGWFNRASYEAGGQFPDGVFLFLADQNRVIVNYVAQGRFEKYALVATVAGPFQWKLTYDPAGAGSVRLDLGSGQSAVLAMGPGDREAMAKLDHFGVVTRYPGGWHVVAFDDLRFTVGRGGAIAAARWLAPTHLEVSFGRPLLPDSNRSGHYALSGPGRGTLAEHPDAAELVGDRVCRLSWRAGSSAAGQEATISVDPAVEFVTAVPLGSRKHMLIDDALVERMENIALNVNPPTKLEVTDFRCDKPWDPTPRFGGGIPDIWSVWDDGDEVRMMYGNGGMWGGRDSAICLASSRDGVHWTKPELGLVPWMGSTRNNIVLRNACQGTAIKDPNSHVAADERYKLLAWCMQRGFYVFTSPDGRRWRRNETAALPFDPDGSIEVFWDDQCGIYRGYLRALAPQQNPTVLRSIVRAQTAEILKPWHFTPAASPHWHVFALPKPASGELPLVETGGEVYRFKGIKYPWAPDVYLSFPWRYLAGTNVRPGSFLMISRDGERWRRYEPPYYLASGWELAGRKVLEALMEQGLIRRGDELWQYGTVRFTEHGGALYGGKEHDGSGFDRLLRLVQRLDGFVSLDAGETPGRIVTRPLVFAGQKLELNVAARGTVRVALRAERGEPLTGFGPEDCDPIRADSVRHVVTWKGRSDVSGLAGRVVRLEFELSHAKLYAFQFTAKN